MASYEDPDQWIDAPGKVPWGEADFDNPDPNKVDSIRKSWWGTNRAANGAWNLIREVGGIVREVGGKIDGLRQSVAGVATELVRVRTYVGRIETKVDALSKKIDESSKPQS